MDAAKKSARPTECSTSMQRKEGRLRRSARSWEVYGDGIAPFRAKILEDIGYARHLSKEFGVGDLAAVARLADS